MKSLKIGVKFCGNCNPAIDARAIVQEIGQRGQNLQFLSYDAPDLDALLMISACLVDCTARPDGDWPVVIVIAGETVDYEPCKESALADVVCERLMRMG